MKKNPEMRYKITCPFFIIALLTVVTQGFSSELSTSDNSKELTIRTTEILSAKDIRSDTGAGFVAQLTKGRPGDRNRSRSNCVLLEDGTPLPMPHALHADIRTKGKGRYSHWTVNSIYFSTSDNSDPRTNGRKYELFSKEQVIQHRTFVNANKATNHYNIFSPVNRKISNQRLIIRNPTGTTSVIPRLTLEGWPDLSSNEGILKSILKPGMNDEEKTLAILKFLIDWRYHYYPAEQGDEVHNPIKLINVYGYGFCDDSARSVISLARQAGLRSRIWGLNGHVVAEIFFDNSWHMIDPDHEVFYRTKEGHIASVQELAAHPEIIKATRRDPVGNETGVMAKLYTTTGDNVVWKENLPVSNHRIEPSLDPGDELIFDLQDQSTFHGQFSPKGKRPPVFGNGKLTRKIEMKNGAPPIHFQWPYVILAGKLRLEGASLSKGIKVSISSNGKTFKYLPQKMDEAGKTFSLDGWIKSQKTALYEYWIRIEKNEIKIEPSQLELITKFQFSPRALPQVQAGKTKFNLFIQTSDKSQLPQKWEGLEVTHEWQENVK